VKSIAETQPQLQAALLRLSAIISQYFTRRILRLLRSTSQRPIAMNGDDVIRVYHDAGNVIETHEHKGDFKEW
jgi:hypothetical protein